MVIFSLMKFDRLLPHTDAKLDPPEGMTELDGLEYVFI